MQTRLTTQAGEEPRGEASVASAGRRLSICAVATALLATAAYAIRKPPRAAQAPTDGETMLDGAPSCVPFISFSAKGSSCAASSYDDLNMQECFVATSLWKMKEDFGEFKEVTDGNLLDPKGCFFRQGASKAYWKEDGTNFRFGRASLCKLGPVETRDGTFALSAGTECPTPAGKVAGVAGVGNQVQWSATRPDGRQWLSKEDCMQVPLLSQIRGQAMQQTDDGEDPTGCFLHQTKVFYNQGGNPNGRDDRFAICKSRCR